MATHQPLENLLHLGHKVLHKGLDLALDGIVKILHELGVLKHVLGRISDDFRLSALQGQLLTGADRVVDLGANQLLPGHVLRLQGILDGLLIGRIALSTVGLHIMSQFVAHRLQDGVAQRTVLGLSLNSRSGVRAAVDVNVDGVGAGNEGTVFDCVTGREVTLEEHHVDVHALGQGRGDINRQTLAGLHALLGGFKRFLGGLRTNLRGFGHLADPAGLTGAASALLTSLGRSVGFCCLGILNTVAVHDLGYAVSHGAGCHINASIAAQVHVLIILHEGVHITANLIVDSHHLAGFHRGHQVVLVVFIADVGQDSRSTLVSRAVDVSHVDLLFGVTVLEDSRQTSLALLEAYHITSYGAALDRRGELLAFQVTGVLDQFIGLLVSSSCSRLGHLVGTHRAVVLQILVQVLLLGSLQFVLILIPPRIASAVFFAGTDVAGHLGDNLSRVIVPRHSSTLRRRKFLTIGQLSDCRGVLFGCGLIRAQFRQTTNDRLVGDILDHLRARLADVISQCAGESAKFAKLHLLAGSLTSLERLPGFVGLSLRAEFLREVKERINVCGLLDEGAILLVLMTLLCATDATEHEGGQRGLNPGVGQPLPKFLAATDLCFMVEEECNDSFQRVLRHIVDGLFAEFRQHNALDVLKRTGLALIEQSVQTNLFSADFHCRRADGLDDLSRAAHVVPAGAFLKGTRAGLKAGHDQHSSWVAAAGDQTRHVVGKAGSALVNGLEHILHNSGHIGVLDRAQLRTTDEALLIQSIECGGVGIVNAYGGFVDLIRHGGNVPNALRGSVNKLRCRQPTVRRERRLIDLVRHCAAIQQVGTKGQQVLLCLVGVTTLVVIVVDSDLVRCHEVVAFAQILGYGGHFPGSVLQLFPVGTGVDESIRALNCVDVFLADLAA